MRAAGFLVGLACFTEAFTLPITPQPNSCPNTETQLSTADNTVYDVCASTYLNGATLSSEVVSTIQACAEKCSQYTGAVRCTYATFRSDGTCSLLAHGGPGAVFIYTADSDSTSFTARSPPTVGPTEGSVLSSCPIAETPSTQYGVTLAGCLGTSYNGRTVEQLGSVASLNDCAQQCATRANCQNAVHDPAAQICYLKDATVTQQLTSTTGLNSIRVTSVLHADGDGTQGCTGSIKTATNRAGNKYQICFNAGWDETPIATKPSRSTSRCSNICDSSRCDTAAYEKGSRVCRTYPSIPTLTFKRGSNTLQYVPPPQES